jgi:hypothetical protein
VGLVLSKASIFMNVCDEIDEFKFDEYYGKMKIKLHPNVVDYFEERKSRLKELFSAYF